jgi:hypothetical protein
LKDEPKIAESNKEKPTQMKDDLEDKEENLKKEEKDKKTDLSDKN